MLFQVMVFGDNLSSALRARQIVREKKKKPLSLVFRGDSTWLGEYDNDGNFIPDPQYPRNYSANGGVGPSPSYVMTNGGQHYAYEHRSGCLIRGTIINKPTGVFVPEIGTAIVDIKAVDLSKPDRMVYNMAEHQPAFVAAMREMYGEGPVPKADDPVMSGTPSGYGYQLFRDILPDHKSPVVVRVMGEVMELGRLSDEGEFQPEPDMPILKRMMLPNPTPHMMSTSDTIVYNVPKKGLEKEDVYEYRSGRLIKGILYASGNFAPEKGSKVLNFKEYDRDKSDRRIYNLPGRLTSHGK
jgi:hypothetical protein